MSLGQSELHLFKLQTLNTGELQLKCLCRFFCGEKVGPSLEKERTNLHVQGKLVQKTHSNGCVNQGITSFPRGGAGELQIVVEGDYVFFVWFHRSEAREHDNSIPT